MNDEISAILNKIYQVNDLSETIETRQAIMNLKYRR